MPDSTRVLIPISQALDGVFPSEWVSVVGDALDFVALDPRHGTLRWTPSGFALRQRLVFFRTDSSGIVQPLELDLPLVSGMTLRLGRPGELFDVDLTIATAPTAWVELGDMAVTLHIPPDILKAYRQLPSGEWRTVEEDGSSRGYDLVWETGIRATFEGDVDFHVPELTGVAPAMIADTGFILEIERLAIVTGALPPGLSPEMTARLPPGFKGILIDAEIHYWKPGSDISGATFTLEDAAVGDGGFSGTVGWGDGSNKDTEYDAETLGGDELPSGLIRCDMGGAKLVLQYVALTFTQSIPTGSEIIGYLFMPLVEKWVRIRATIGGPDGDLLIEVGGAGGDELISLEVDWLEIKAESIAYVLKDGIHYAQITGSVKPKLGDLDWPTLKADELLIGSDGTVEMKGGWIDVPESFALDFHAFKIVLTRFGFGTETRGEGTATEQEWQWMGFSGSVSLVEGIPITASVEGLKFSWPQEGEGDLEVSLQGIAVHLEIPDTLLLDGSLAYEKLTPDNNPDGLTGEIFKGHILLDLKALRTQVAGELIVGHIVDADGHEFPVFFIVLKAELPAPIPLGCTGAGIYGMAGLFGAHIAPDRRETEGSEEPESWYEWYKKADPGEAYSVTPVRKWEPMFDNWAFGAGLTLGTQYDDGFTFNIAALVAVLIPGPVIMIEGKANLLKQRGDRRTEGAFYALAVIDGRAGTFQLNVDIRYSVEGIIAVGGGLEVFFDFNDSTAWYLYVGRKEPVEKRIMAQVLSLITAKVYFMIDNFGLQIGAFIGVEWRENYGPVEIAIVARLSFDAAIFWKPLHLEGAIELYGEIVLKIFGIGFELILQLLLEARAPLPYWIHGKAKFKLTMPWPLPTIDAEAEFTWEEPKPAIPVTPYVKGVALAHHKTPGASWALTARNRDDLSRRPAAELDAEAPPTELGKFPVDVRPVLSLTRPIYGLPANLAAGQQQQFADRGPDVVGHATFKYQLSDVRLDVFDAPSGRWGAVRLGINAWDSDLTFAVDDLSFLNGWEAQEPQLELWRQHALDLAERSQREEQALRRPPCVERPQPRIHCVDWRFVDPGVRYPPDFRHHRVAFHAALGGDSAPIVRALGTDARAPRVLSAGGILIVELPEEALSLTARVFGQVNATASFRGVDAGPVAAVAGDGWTDLRVDRPVDRLILNAPVAVAATRPLVGISAAAQARIELQSVGYLVSHTVIEIGKAEESGPGQDPVSQGARLILEPGRTYRLSVDSRIAGGPETVDESQYFYFRTDDGPGTTAKNDAAAPHRETPSNQLATYVAHTVPAHGGSHHYRGHDVRVDFNEGYVAAMYREPLQMRLRNQDGTLVTGPTTSALRARALRPAGLLTLMAASGEGSCASYLADDAAAGSLWFSPGAIGPERLLQAEIINSGREDSDKPLFTFQFATSRYRDFREHMLAGVGREAFGRGASSFHAPDGDFLASFRGAREGLAAAQAEVDNARAAGDLLALADVDARVDAASAALDAAANSTFTLLAAAGDVVSSKLPIAVEVIVAPVGGATGFVLAVESPEPIDWARVTVTTPGLGTDGVEAVWNADRTRAFLCRRGIEPWFPTGRLEIVLELDGAARNGLPQLTAGGAVVRERADWQIDLPTVRRAA